MFGRRRRARELQTAALLVEVIEDITEELRRLAKTAMEQAAECSRLAGEAEAIGDPVTAARARGMAEAYESIGEGLHNGLARVGEGRS